MQVLLTSALACLHFLHYSPNSFSFPLFPRLSKGVLENTKYNPMSFQPSSPFQLLRHPAPLIHCQLPVHTPRGQQGHWLHPLTSSTHLSACSTGEHPCSLVMATDASPTAVAVLVKHLARWHGNRCGFSGSPTNHEQQHYRDSKLVPSTYI